MVHILWCPSRWIQWSRVPLKALSHRSSLSKANPTIRLWQHSLKWIQWSMSSRNTPDRSDDYRCPININGWDYVLDDHRSMVTIAPRRFPIGVTLLHASKLLWRSHHDQQSWSSRSIPMDSMAINCLDPRQVLVWEEIRSIVKIESLCRIDSWDLSKTKHGFFLD
jgi:hypothetical protein